MMKMARIPIVALFGALAISTPGVAAAQTETERVDRTVNIRAGGQVRIKNFSGRVTVTGSRRGDVAVHAIRRAPRERLDHIKLEVTETGSGVTIEANKKDSEWRDRNNNVVDTELEIQVPQDVSLDIDVFSSGIRITDVQGKQRLKTFSGDIDITGAESSVDAETFSGDIELKLASSVGGRVNFSSFSGSLRSDAGLVTRSSSRRNVTGEIGSGGSHEFYFKTFSGDVRIR
jgi:DUF4097 and DUF4098 domain-containing protein YvlB